MSELSKRAQRKADKKAARVVKRAELLGTIETSKKTQPGEYCSFVGCCRHANVRTFDGVLYCRAHDLNDPKVARRLQRAEAKKPPVPIADPENSQLLPNPPVNLVSTLPRTGAECEFPGCRAIGKSVPAPPGRRYCREHNPLLLARMLHAVETSSGPSAPGVCAFCSNPSSRKPAPDGKYYCRAHHPKKMLKRLDKLEKRTNLIESRPGCTAINAPPPAKMHRREEPLDRL